MFLLHISVLAQAPPFSKGVNITSWFQVSDARLIQLSQYSKEDFVQIQSLGCDVIRLPVNLHGMTDGTPAHTLDPLFLSFLDQVIDWAEELQIHLIIDNHSFDPAVSTSPAIEDVLIAVWMQLADHLRSRSQLIVYEILNEPHGIEDSLWGAIQGRAIDSIRVIDSVHTIIVGPAGWNSFHNLSAMPSYADTNLIYTFHFYDPFLFTHQGATWTSPSMASVAGIPYPYDPSRMPPVPSELRGSWIEGAYSSYPGDGMPANVRQLIDIAAQFGTSRDVPLLCGEFGVYKPNSNDSDRTEWYRDVRSHLEQKGIAWTTWDYRGGFGLFRSGTDELFESDVNLPLIDALGLVSPDQTTPVTVPDSSTFGLYGDQYETRMIIASNPANGTIEYYSAQAPHSGSHCIAWTNSGQYGLVGFDFRPNRDMSFLVGEGYLLSLYIRSDTPGTMLDLRFVDTKTTVPGDHPWRMRWTLDQFSLPGDNVWHHVMVPLSAFTEHGAWDNGWYEPQGFFDWKAIDRFEIVAEHHDLHGRTVWLDDISIASPAITDAAVRASSPLSFRLMNNVPNPFNPSTLIRFTLAVQNTTRIRVYDQLGREVASTAPVGMLPGSHTIRFTGTGLPSGPYYYVLISGPYRASGKMLLLK